MVLVKKAVATANQSLGMLPAEIATATVGACDEFIADKSYVSQFPINVFQSGAGRSFNMNVNGVIANIALQQKGSAKGRYDIINPIDHVNKSQSDSNAYPTGFRIALYRESERLPEALERLRHGFDRKASEFTSVLKMDRTQLQDTIP